MATEFFKQADFDGSDFSAIAQQIDQYEAGQCQKSSIVASYYALVAGDAFRGFIRAMLAKIQCDNAFSPTWMAGSECAIVASKHCTLSIRQVAPDTGRELIYAAPGGIIITLMSAASVAVDIYKAEGATSPLRWVREETLMQGQSVEIEPPYACQYRLNGKPALFSRLMMDADDHTAVYDAKSLDYISMLSLDPNNTRWYFMAKLASQLASEKATPILEQLTGHHNYNVRWTALQELFNHDTDKAVAILNQFKTDSNAFIREQAELESLRIAALLAEEDE
jgi:hypothetical protein